MQTPRGHEGVSGPSLRRALSPHTECSRASRHRGSERASERLKGRLPSGSGVVQGSRDHAADVPEGQEVEGKCR